MKKSIALILLFLSAITTAQTKYTISGYVRDTTSGEDLIGSIVSIKEIPSLGASTNAYGFYSISVPEGNYFVIIQSMGYKPKVVKVELNQNRRIDVKLRESVNELNEVTVTTEVKNENITKTQMGVEKIDIKEIEKIPVIFGEKDILKTIQLMPGVKSAGEGGSGFFVRGGAADQNLIYLDEATVYNAAHLLGFFSVFNSDALKDITLYKGTQPAEYGGRLSSVLDVKMLDGNDKKFGVEGGIGIIASRLKIDGPIVKDKGSFTISGRRTYADLFLKLSSDAATRSAKLYFYDLNAKTNYRINDKNRVFLSGYFGKDVLGFGTTFGIDWGNATGTLRWNHLFSSKLFSNTSVIFSNYNYNIHISGANKIKIVSKIQDWNAKMDFQYFLNSKNRIKFGFNSIYHKIVPGVVILETNTTTLSSKYSSENAAYISNEFKPSNHFSIEYGLRGSSFSVLGPGNFYNYNKDGTVKDTMKYTSNKVIKTYYYIEPRIGINYIISEKTSIKGGYSRNVQNMHLLSNSTSGNPTDSWIPTSNIVKPEISDQVSLGYYQNFKENKYQFSTEIYYKDLKNQIDYKDGAQILLNENAEADLLFGIGRAYGIEFCLKKKFGKFTGWVGYTLSRTEKKIENINQGNWYVAKQDRTHDVSVVGMYELTKKWNVAATWVYYTGNAVTFPSGKYEVAGQVVNYYTERNGYRMPAYHRLDIGVTWNNKKTAKYESNWNFSCYNVYGRQNAYSITFQPDPNDPTKTQAVQTSLFRWVPSITYNFKF